MSNSLIVRDATLAINGVNASGNDPEAHVRARVDEARTLDDSTVKDCAEVLRASAGASGGDPDVLEALVVIALAHPAIAQEYDLSPQVMGRRLAARLERTGEAARALAVLRLLVEYFPGNDALEREMAALMRRQGMVQDLAERYLDRAEELLAKGQEDEAVAWFREVLLLDRSRSDVARRIRQLKSDREENLRVGKRRKRLILLSLLLSASSVAVVQRETSLSQAYKSLPPASSSDASAIERRLVQVERFVSRHPIWHGSLNAMKERNKLRYELRLEEGRRQSEEDQDTDTAFQPSQNERADQARKRAYNLIYGSLDYVGALEQLLQALQLADEDWVDREQTERDIESIEAHLKENPNQ